MKSVVITVLLSIILGFASATVANGQKQEIKLTEKAKVIFPGTPNKSGNEASDLYLLKLPDSTANFIASVTDLQKTNGFDEATLVQASMQPEFWEQAAKGLMSQMGNEAKEISRTMKNIKGYDAMQMEIQRPNHEGKTNTITALIFLEGVKSINIMHTNRGGRADAQVTKDFFESVTIQ
jgi:hypothetical protein